MAPAMLMDPANRPTKIDRASDVTGLVDTGELGTLFSDPRDTVAVMESDGAHQRAEAAAASTRRLLDATTRSVEDAGASAAT